MLVRNLRITLGVLLVLTIVASCLMTSHAAVPQAKEEGKDVRAAKDELEQLKATFGHSNVQVYLQNDKESPTIEVSTFAGVTEILGKKYLIFDEKHRRHIVDPSRVTRFVINR